MRILFRYTGRMKIGDYEIQIPFVTTAVESVKDALFLATIQENEKFVDLGSGDGRVVLEFAKAGAIAHGYELKSPLVVKSRKRINDAGLGKRAEIFERSFWEAKLSEYDVIYLYGMQSVMGKIETKILQEAKPGTRVLANVFHFPRLHLKKTKGYISLYVVS
jgi:cyclopropane fatty-acyl-phospholipid synthase-like methyltransferase